MSTYSRRNRLISAAVSVGVASAAVALTIAGGGHASAAAQPPFTAGDLVVYRVGDGTLALTSAAAPVFLDEYATTAGSAPVESLPLPTAVDGAQHRLTASGTSVSEGSLGLSADGRYLLASGYDITPGTAGVPSAVNPATAGRVVARVDGNGLVDTTTSLADSSAPAVTRAVASANGSSFYLAGSGGPISSVPLGAVTGTPVDSTGTVFTAEYPNVNALGIVDGQLYASGANGVSVSAIDTEKSSATVLAGLPTRALATSFALLAVGSATPNVLYYVDGSDRAGAIEKYTLVGSTWTQAGSVALDGAESLTAAVDGADVSLYATTATTIVSLADPAAATSTLAGTPTLIATATADEVFRGISFAPSAVSGPSIVETAPAAGTAVPAGSSTVTVSAQAIAPASSVASVTASIDGNPTPVVATQVNGAGDYTATVPLTGLADGAHTVTVTATDGGGLTASDSRVVTITGAPAAPVGPVAPMAPVAPAPVAPAPVAAPAAPVAPAPVAPAPTTTTTVKIPSGDANKGNSYSFVSSGLKVTKSGFVTVKYTGAPKGGKGLQAKGKGSIQVTFYGTEVDLHLGQAKNSGRVQILIDGKVKLTIDLNNTKSKDLVEKLKGLKLGFHTIKIVALHQKSAKSAGYAVTVGWLKIS